MLDKNDLNNLSAILMVAKFDNITVQSAAVLVALTAKVQELAKAPDGNSDSTSPDQPSTDQPQE